MGHHVAHGPPRAGGHLGRQLRLVEAPYELGHAAPDGAVLLRVLLHGAIIALMDDKDLVRQLALGRIAFGVSAVAAPRRFNRGWIGSTTGDQPGARLMARAFGVRDAAIGIITLRALDEGSDHLTGILQLGAVCDAVDAAATAVAFPHLPKVMRFATFAIATSAAVVGFRAAARL